jgi:hypothetical protein
MGVEHIDNGDISRATLFFYVLKETEHFLLQTMTAESTGNINTDGNSGTGCRLSRMLLMFRSLAHA